MDKLVYLYYIVLPVILLWGCKVSKRGEWNEGCLSLSQMKALQGFAALGVMFHHLGQKTCAPWHMPSVIIHGLDMFVPIGYILVGIFLFCSGYGLMKSIRTKTDYLKGFFTRRVLPILLAYYSTGLIFLLVRYIMGERMDTFNLIMYITGLKLANPNGWFAVALPFFYLAFYLAFRFCKKQKVALLLTCLFILAYQLLGASLNHNEWWMAGEWWYNSAQFFSIGLIFAYYEDKIMSVLKKRYLLLLIVSVVGSVVFYLYSEFAQGYFSYYGENFHANLVILRRCMCLLSQILASFFILSVVFLLGMKVKIGNRFLAFMGTLTLEFYLIHGLFSELFGYSFLDYAPSIYYVKNVALFVLIVFTLSVPSAWLLQRFHRAIIKLVTRKKKQ